MDNLIIIISQLRPTKLTIVLKTVDFVPFTKLCVNSALHQKSVCFCIFSSQAFAVRFVEIIVIILMDIWC